MNGSIFFTSFAATNCAGSKSRTSPAMRVGNVVASKWVTGPMPLLPARIFLHAMATSLPTGLMIPSPVIATRRLLMSLPLRSSLIARVKKRPSMVALFTGVHPCWKRKLRPQAQLRTDRAVLSSGFDVCLDVIDRLLHGGDLLGFLVRNLALELFFQSHHQFYGVERIRAQIIH